MTTSLRVNGERLLSRLLALGEIGAIPNTTGNARLALSDADRGGRDLVTGWMRELGLEVTIDAFGNGFGLRRGREDGPPVMTGSHIDTVATGGRYDGNLGVLSGLEVVQTLNEAGVTTRRPLCVAFFTNEEGARFQPDMMGSLVWAGGLPLEKALDTVGIDGKKAGDELRRIGYAGPAPVGRPSVHAYVELHIEQGPVLEAEGFQIGAVTGVQGISWTELVLTGQSNHAGTTPMSMRHDAALVAAEITAFARRTARELGGHQVATVGLLKLEPNLVNVVARQAVMTVDLRNTEEAVLQEAERRVFAFAEEAARAEGVKLQRRTLARFQPVAFDPKVVGRVESIAREKGLRVRRLPSGAGHDAQIAAGVCPAGMIFVPSVKGISHNVEEYTAPADLAAGADVLLQLLVELAS